MLKCLKTKQKCVLDIQQFIINITVTPNVVSQNCTVKVKPKNPAMSRLPRNLNDSVKVYLTNGRR